MYQSILIHILINKKSINKGRDLIAMCSLGDFKIWQTYLSWVFKCVNNGPWSSKHSGDSSLLSPQWSKPSHCNLFGMQRPLLQENSFVALHTP